MPVITETEPGSFDDFFGRYTKALPDVASRHEAASVHAAANVRGSAASFAVHEYRSYLHLLTHWGDDNAALSKVANFIYRLGAATEDAFYQPAMVFRRGTPADVSAQEFIEEDIWLPKSMLDQSDEEAQLTIEYGIVDSPELSHGFAANLGTGVTDRKQRRLGVEPPYLGFGVTIPVRRSHNITADLSLGTCDVTPARERESLMACVGAVSLVCDENLETYRNNRRRDERIVVVGSGACNVVFNGLERKSYRSQPEKSVLRQLRTYP